VKIIEDTNILGHAVHTECLKDSTSGKITFAVHRSDHVPDILSLNNMKEFMFSHFRTIYIMTTTPVY
jgi:hypothetical protein